MKKIIIIFMLAYMTMYPASIYATTSCVDPYTSGSVQDYKRTEAGNGTPFVDKIFFKTQEAKNGAQISIWTHAEQNDNTPREGFETGLYDYNIYVNGIKVTTATIYTGLYPERTNISFNFSSGITEGTRANAIEIIPQNIITKEVSNNITTKGYALPDGGEMLYDLECGSSVERKMVIMTEKFRVNNIYNEYFGSVIIETTEAKKEVQSGTGFEHEITITYKYTVVENETYLDDPTGAEIDIINKELPNTLNTLFRKEGENNIIGMVESDEPIVTEEIQHEKSPVLLEPDENGYIPGWYTKEDPPTGFMYIDEDSARTQYKYERWNPGGKLWGAVSGWTQCPSSAAKTPGYETGTYKTICYRKLYNGYFAWTECNYARSSDVRYSYTKIIKESDWVLNCNSGQFTYNPVTGMNHEICVWEENVSYVPRSFTGSYPITQRATGFYNEGVYKNGTSYSGTSCNFPRTVNKVQGLAENQIKQAYCPQTVVSPSDSCDFSTIVTNAKSSLLNFKLISGYQTPAFRLTSEYDMFDYDADYNCDIYTKINQAGTSEPSMICMNDGIWYQIESEAIDSVKNNPQLNMNNGTWAGWLKVSDFYARTKEECKLQPKYTIPPRWEYYNDGNIVTSKYADSWTYKDNPSGEMPSNWEGKNPISWEEYDRRIVYRYLMKELPERQIKEITVVKKYTLPEVYIEDWTADLYSTGDKYSGDNTDSANHELKYLGRRIYTHFYDFPGKYTYNVVGEEISNLLYNVNYVCEYEIPKDTLFGGTEGLGINEVFRRIELNNMFPGRGPGENWVTESAILKSKEIESEGNSIYKKAPIYNVILERNDIMSIKGYNSRQECLESQTKECGYLDYYRLPNGSWKFGNEYSNLFK